MNRECLKLYAVTDRAWLRGETLADQVEKAIRGGVTMVQLREKDLDFEQFLAEALTLRELCGRYHVPFIVNDSVEIARLCNADGVHVGQEDRSVAEARQMLGQDRIIGATCKTVKQALEAQRQGADYIGSGAVFPSTAKPEAVPISRETLEGICASVQIPVVAIGGITLDYLTVLRGTGIAGVAVVSAVFAQPDITTAAEELNQAVTQIL